MPLSVWHFHALNGLIFDKKGRELGLIYAKSGAQAMD